LNGLNDIILIKKSRIDKLAVVKCNLESFLLSLVITIYFYYNLLNFQQVQIQKNLIKRILLICVFNYLLPLFFIVIKEPKKSVRSKYKREENNNTTTKKEKKGKTVIKEKIAEKKKR
jgi:hypothetical protein